jgi:uncharacterized membrane protein
MVMKSNRFRFPIAGITFMVLTLGVVLLAIRNARELANSFAGSTYLFKGHMYVYQPEGLSFVQTFGFAFGITLVVAVLIWAVLHRLHRSGVHRLAEAETWPKA